MLFLLSAAVQVDAQVILKPARIFDGEKMLPGDQYVVVVHDERIEAVGPAAEFATLDYAEIELPGMTLLPGLIDLHTHVFLHPYEETSWSDQALKEPHGVRIVRAVRHLEATLLAGFTTIRDLGTEGAGSADADLRRALEAGLISGPRLITSTRAIAATGGYGPTSYASHVAVPRAAQIADGEAAIVQAAREQIASGADWIKVYADYPYGPEREHLPTYSLAELEAVAALVRDSGRFLAVHAMSSQGLERAVLAGAATIEHGNGATPELFRLMAKRGVAWCPTLSAIDATRQIRGWNKGVDPDPPEVTALKAVFRMALQTEVTIANCSDAGPFPHGENWREIVTMVDYGMNPLDALRSATSINARVLRLDNEIGRIAPGLVADIIAVNGDPLDDISVLRNVAFVMQAGEVRAHAATGKSDGNPCGCE